jgi:hypothetical protein
MFRHRSIPSGRVVGHDEVGEASIGYVVKEVLLPNVSQLAVVGRNLGQNCLCSCTTFVNRGDELREFRTQTLREITLARLMLGENCRASGYECVYLHNHHDFSRKQGFRTSAGLTSDIRELWIPSHSSHHALRLTWFLTRQLPALTPKNGSSIPFCAFVPCLIAF